MSPPINHNEKKREVCEGISPRGGRKGPLIHLREKTLKNLALKKGKLGSRASWRQNDRPSSTVPLLQERTRRHRTNCTQKSEKKKKRLRRFDKEKKEGHYNMKKCYKAGKGVGLGTMLMVKSAEKRLHRRMVTP